MPSAYSCTGAVKGWFFIASTMHPTPPSLRMRLLFFSVTSATRHGPGWYAWHAHSLSWGLRSS
jgi:hypothetical protein